jgi:predicted dehydrogenase
MGYHILDQLVWYFGLPIELYASSAPKLYPEKQYQVEETVSAIFRYKNGCIGNLSLSLCEPRKREVMEVHGSHGSYILKRKSFKRYDRKGVLVESLSRRPAWPTEVQDILAQFVENVGDYEKVRQEVRHGISVMTLVDGIYRSVNLHKPVRVAEEDK